MSLLDLEILQNDILNQPISILTITVVIGMLTALASFLWKKRKPRVSIVARCAIQNGERGLSLKVTNYSEQQIRIEAVGYDIFGEGNPNQCVSLMRNKTLDPKSTCEIFVEEKDLNLEFMRSSKILFMKDQLGRVWKANSNDLAAVQRYDEFKEKNMQESL